MVEADDPPLTEAEVLELEDHLVDSLELALGYLTGILTRPEKLPPAEWQPVLLGGAPRFESHHEAARVTRLLKRLQCSIRTELDALAVTTPAPEDPVAVERWCLGYLRAVEVDGIWTRDEEALVMLFPFAVLAGRINLVGQKDDDGRVIEDDRAICASFRRHLNDQVLRAYHYWKRHGDQPPTLH